MTHNAFNTALSNCTLKVATGGIGYWGNWGSFYSAPQDFVVLVLGVFCARFPPREAGPGGSTEIGPETDGATGLWAFKLISFLE